MSAARLPVGSFVRIEKPELGTIIDQLRALGYRVIGPALGASAIVYDEISGIEDPIKRNNTVRAMAGEATKKGKERGHKYSAEDQNISKLLKEINKLTSKWSPEEMAIATYALGKNPEWKPTESELDFMITLVQKIIHHTDELGLKITK